MTSAWGIVPAVSDGGDGADPEAEVQRACESGDQSSAAQLALSLYGDDILRYLVALTHDQTLADEAFGVFAEHLWRGILRFRWQSKLKTWAYVVARNALRAVKNDPYRRRAVPLSDAGVGSARRAASNVNARVLAHRGPRGGAPACGCSSIL